MRDGFGGEGLGWDADDVEGGKDWGNLVWSTTLELDGGLRSGGECEGRLEVARELKERVVEGGWRRCRRLREMSEVNVELWRGSRVPGRSAGGRDENGGCGCCKLPGNGAVNVCQGHGGMKFCYLHP